MEFGEYHWLFYKFDFKPRKSYSPPDFAKINKDLFGYYLVGFIDGDGCIKNQYNRSDAYMRLKLHSSWLDSLIFINNYIVERCGVKPVQARINNYGYATFSISNRVSLRYLKLLANKVPALERKWSRIDENSESRNESTGRKRERVLQLREEGKSQKEIAHSMSIAYVSQTLKRIGGCKNG